MKKLILILSLACLSMGIKADQFTLEELQIIVQDITALLTEQDTKVPTNFTNDLTNFALMVTQDNNILDEALLKEFLKETLNSYGICDEQVITQAIENCKQNQKAEQVRADEEFARTLEAETTTQPANNNVELDDPELEVAIAENLEAQRDTALEKAIEKSEQLKRGTKLLRELLEQIRTTPTTTVPSTPQDTTNPMIVSDVESNVSGACPICTFNFEHGEKIFELSCQHTIHADCAKEFYNRRNTQYEQDLITSSLTTVPLTGTIEFKCPLCNEKISPIDEVAMSEL